MVTTTTVYSFQKPAVAGDEDQWGTYLNNNIDKYESILTGNTTITSLVITTADINGGTLDNVVIGGTTAAAVTGTTITGTSFVSSGDMTFGDNDKAIFGAGSDLSIFHDGSNNRLNVTSGNLYVNLPDTSEFTVTGTQNTAFKVDVDSAVTLYNNGSPKLTTTSTGIDVTGTVTATGGAFTGNVTFGDSDEARFGAGSDLRIYHNGSNSIIWDEGVGNLQLVSSGASVDIIKAGGENMATFATDGAATLYFDNAAKIATSSTGISVTGTVTADGLTVDATSEISLVSDKTVTTPHTDYNLLLDNGSDTEFVIRLDSVFSGSIGSSHIKQISEGTNRGALVFATESGSGGVVPDRLKIDYNGDISFYEDTGTTAKFFWDASAEALALGTATSVSNNRLVIDQASGDGQNSGFYMQRNGGTGTSFKLDIDGNDVANFRRSSTTALAIDNSANVGIGTTSPTSKFQVDDSNNSRLSFAESGVGNSYVTIRAGANTKNSVVTFSNATDSTTGSIDYDHAVDALDFFTNGANRRMRLTNDGNVLIGKTVIDNTTAGHRFANSGFMSVVRDGNTAAVYNRLTSDGTIIDFRKDGTTVGNIRAEGSGTGFTLKAAASNGYVAFHANNQSTGIFFEDATTKRLAPYSSRDNEFDLGGSSRRWKDLYLSGGLRGDTTFKNNAGTTEYARFDSSGRLLIGTTTANTTGITLHEDGEIYAVRDGDKVAIFDRSTSNGDILVFRKDGTTVGSIGASSNILSIVGKDGNGGLAIQNNTFGDIIYPASNTTGGASDNAIDLGYSSGRFKDLYLSGGVYLGGTGSANHLDDYEEGTFQSTLTPRTSGTITLLTAYDVLSYTKVGRAVTVTGDLVVSSLSSPVGASIELSLPFTIANLSELSGRVGGAVSYYDASVARTTKPYVGLEGTDYILVTLDPSTLASSDSITFSVTYFTT